MKKLFNKYLSDRKFFILCLALCPALAVTTTFENSYITGLVVFIIILLSNISLLLIKRVVKGNILIPIFAIISAIFVTIVDYLMQTYIGELSSALGIYISLIVINGIILDKVLSEKDIVKFKESVVESLKLGLSYMVLLSILGLIREIIGSNTITIMDNISSITGYIMKYEILPANDVIPNQFFLTASGAFLTLGLLLGFINSLRRGDEK